MASLTPDELAAVTYTHGPKVPITALELNALYKPIFQAWLDEHHVRPDCPACESPDYLLTTRVLLFSNAELDGPWHIYIRLCRNCGHMLQFDLPLQIAPAAGFIAHPIPVDPSVP